VTPRLRGLVVAACCASLQAAAGEPREDAARLAILAERVGKLRAQAMEGVAPERARRALQSATRSFDATLAEAALRPPAALREHYALLRLLWRDYRAWLARPAGRDTARTQVDRDDELNYLAMKGVAANGPLESPRDGLARAARASQRAARLALLRRDVPTPSLAGEEQAALAELREVLDALSGATAADPALAAEIQVAQNQWPFLAQALEAKAPRNARALDVAARSADHILEAMERALARTGVPPPAALPPTAVPAR
jgi:hypothetical protein